MIVVAMQSTNRRWLGSGGVEKSVDVCFIQCNDVRQHFKRQFADETCVVSLSIVDHYRVSFRRKKNKEEPKAKDEPKPEKKTTPKEEKVRVAKIDQ